MRIEDYYSSIVGNGRRNVPTYSEVRRDLSKVLEAQYGFVGRF